MAQGTSSQGMNDAQKVGLVRNALLVAGYEMGESGEHWPVINATIHDVAKDWQESLADQRVDDEMKDHLYAQLQDMEKQLLNCDAKARLELEPMIRDLREACDAYFEPCDVTLSPHSNDDAPAHIKRAETIIATLGEDHE